MQTISEHLKVADQTYTEHRRQAWWAAGQLVIAAAAAFVHGIFPAMLQTTPGRRVGAVVAVFKGRMPSAS